MTTTTLLEVQDQIQKYWAPKFYAKLRAGLVLPSLVNRDYEGDIRKGGDTVRVSQISDPTGETLTVGTDAGSFNPEVLSTAYVDVKADKRYVASHEFQDLVELQSQIDREDLMEGMLYAIQSQINKHLYSLVSPSTSSPDHSIASVTDFNKSQLSACRLLASQAKWGRSKPWYMTVDPSYYTDLLNDTTLTSADFVGQGAPLVVGGQTSMQRFGFNIFEDNSITTTDSGIAFHPDFMIWVVQQAVNVQVSSKHSNNQFGFVMSADLIGGAKLGIEGSKKHIEIYNSTHISAL